MSKKCNINDKKVVMFGNNVSHSNRKTRRRFLPNIQSFALWSDALNRNVKVDMTAHSMRTVEHNHGLDNYLLSTPSSKLTKIALLIKKRVKSALLKRDTGINCLN